jgi:hypothetical protein
VRDDALLDIAKRFHVFRIVDTLTSASTSLIGAYRRRALPFAAPLVPVVLFRQTIES